MIYYFRNLFILILLAFCVSSNTHAQTLKAYEKAAKTALEQGDYYNAVHYYELVLKSKQTADIYYNYAEACRQSYAFSKAETAYAEVLKNPLSSQYPKLNFHYASTLKHNGKYDLAYTHFSDFVKNYPYPTDFLWLKAQQERQACQLAQTWIDNANDSIQFEALREDINTEFSDFAPVLYNDTFYYASLRFERQKPKNEKREKQAHKRLISKVLFSTDWENKKGNLWQQFNKKSQHTAHIAFDPTAPYMYINYCMGKQDSISCFIYRSHLESDTWSKPKLLPVSINMNGYTASQPHIAWDSITQTKYLYFVSDRPKGEGKLDIWRSIIEQDTFYKAPENLGPVINTPDDESSPFYQSANQKLFFSSKWHYGLGGFDIFESQLDSMGKWEKPQNLGIPFNSAANDLYFVWNTGDTTGFLASNRLGSKTITEESCCNDLYTFQIPVTTDSIPQKDSLITSITPNLDTFPTDSNIVTIDIIEEIEELNKMLPLTLYFHNDEPDSNTTSTTTNKPYQLAYQHYISLENEYKDQHSQQFNPPLKAAARERVADFFDTKVVGEYERMNAFFDKLLLLLDNGVELEIHIKGYTSPRSNEGYNQALAQRRITCVRKHLFVYKKGAFLPHFRNGHFAVQEIPLGESTVPKGVIADFDDPQNSIYSVEAAQERRAEIIVIQRKSSK